MTELPRYRWRRERRVTTPKGTLLRARYLRG